MKQPNLIFVFPDQLGANHLGCYGNEVVSTPNIDRFAQRSLLFERAYTSSPVCTPYRGVLFTGRYPSTTGVIENGMRLPDDVGPTLADVLGAVGYHTAYLGKWHLSGDPQENRWVPPEHRGGFSDFTGWESHHVDHWKGRIWTDGPPPGDANRPSPRELPMPGHETDALTDMAIDKLRELSAGEKPFCLFVAYQAPHPPCSPPPEFASLYGRKLPAHPNLPEGPPDYDKPGWNASYSNDEFRRRYLAEVSHLDAAMGRLFASIDELGLFGSSVVVFTSDHGELAGAHGRYGKFVMYEESVRVPLIVSMPPGIGEPGAGAGVGGGGVRVRDLFSTVDFYPTFAELCGAGTPGGDEAGSAASATAQVPAERAPAAGARSGAARNGSAAGNAAGGELPTHLPGVSFAARWLELASGRNDAGHRDAGERDESTRGDGWGGPRELVFMEYHDRAVTDGRYKLVTDGPRSRGDGHSFGTGTTLFDLETDPYELDDRAGDPTLAAVERRLSEALAEWAATLR